MVENKFCIIIPVYNSEQWIKKCIDSVKIQTYKNYEVIIINDCSTDKTYGEIVCEIKGFNKFHLINNTKKSCALENTVKGIHYICKNDEDIIVILDGDDWLADETVLEYMNEVYQEDIWVTWGSFKLCTTDKICKHEGFNWCVSVKEEFHRRIMARFVFSHLRTYKYFLFKAIREEDLRDKNGKYYTTSGDVIVALPLIEMAGHKHRKCVDKVLYCYNNNNQLNDMKRCPDLQKKIYKEFKEERNIYEPYVKVKTRKNEPSKVDILIWTKDRACQLDLLLRSIKYGFSANCGKVYVRYDYTNAEFKKGYDKLFTKDYGIEVIGIETTGDLGKDTKDIVNNKIDTRYMLAICDDDVFIRPVDV
jgi:glycosyltransferase involved in cell wall biosynthesis